MGALKYGTSSISDFSTRSSWHVKSKYPNGITLAGGPWSNDLPPPRPPPPPRPLPPKNHEISVVHCRQNSIFNILLTSAAATATKSWKWKMKYKKKWSSSGRFLLTSTAAASTSSKAHFVIVFIVKDAFNRIENSICLSQIFVLVDKSAMTQTRGPVIWDDNKSDVTTQLPVWNWKAR